MSVTCALLFHLGLFHGDFFIFNCRKWNKKHLKEKWKGEHREKEEASGLLPLSAFFLPVLVHLLWSRQNIKTKEEP